MRTEARWLIAMTCALAAQPVVATDFKEIQVWLGGGLGGQHVGFAALADGVLAILNASDPYKIQHEVCARATSEEMAVLSRLVAEVPATAPWGEHRLLTGNCSDDLHIGLNVTTSRGELDISYSVLCRPAHVPAWLEKLTDAMRKTQQQHEACRTTENH